MQFVYNESEVKEHENAIRAKTSKYAATVLAGFMNPNNTAITGMPTPSDNDSDYLYSVSSAGTVKLNSTTTSVVIAYDPEVSLRSGQLHVNVYEIGSTNYFSQVNIGRPSTDFTSAAVIYSSLKVQNASANDTIAGNQVHAVLQAQPRDLPSMTQSQLISYVTDRSRDYVSMNSNTDGTRSQVLTDHLGNKPAIMSEGQVANVASTVYRLSATASGNNLEFPTGPWTAGGLASSGTVLYNTGLQTDRSVLPFSSSTYASRVSVLVNFSQAAGTTFFAGTGGTRVLRANFIDYGGNSIGSRNLTGTFINGTTVTAGTAVVSFSGSCIVFNSTTPIYNVTITAVGFADSEAVIDLIQVDVEAISETADIPIRKVHVVRIDGVNSAASIQLEPEVVLAALPSADRMFVSNLTSNQEEIDTQFLGRILKKAFTSLDKVSSLSGHSFISNVMHASTEALSGVMSDTSKLEAFSFSSIGKSFKHISNIVKEARNTGSNILKTVNPAIKFYAKSGLPGSEYAGDAERLIEVGKKYGVIKSMSLEDRTAY